MEFSKYKNLRAPLKYLRRSREEEFDPGPYRTEFDRDRDRILYSKAFRRMKGKTQVFISSGADHLRTRLTHTLEVSQISRIIAYNLNLDGILTEAIALGHDLGHTPFGHVGERTLNQIMNNCDQLGDFQENMGSSDKGFRHNWQGLRVVCDLENLYGKPGLNLSNFTLWGILNHTNLQWKECLSYFSGGQNECFLLRKPDQCSSKGSFDLGFYEQYLQYLELENKNPAWSFEGFVVAQADEIAQRHHDMEDALNAGIIDHTELFEVLNSYYKEYFSSQSKIDLTSRSLMKQMHTAKSDREFLSYLSKLVVSFYTTHLIESSRKNLAQFIKEMGFFRRAEFVQPYLNVSEGKVKKIIGLPEGLDQKDGEMKSFLRDRMLNSHKAQLMDGKGRFIIRRLFKAYITNPRQLFDSTILAVFSNYNKQYSRISGEDKREIGKLRNEIDLGSNKSNPQFQIALLRAICDNISGMTDDFAHVQHENLYG